MSEPEWPSVDEQLVQSRVVHGSALERLIRENQEPARLQPEEATSDRVDLPAWLRVYWRRQHPESEYSADDPTGGYPHALENLYTWMVTHQDLQPEPDVEPEQAAGPTSTTALPKALAEAIVPSRTVGADLRISGAQTTSRSESDIRVDVWNTDRIIGASNAPGASRQAQFFSSDGGATWGQTTLPLALGDTLHSDPTVDWTSDGTAWATTLGIQGANLRGRAYRSADGGTTWTFDGTFSGNQTAVDKQLMWVDHSPTSPFRDNVYVIWHNNRPVFVNRRTGPTGTWQTPVQVSGAETTGTGIGGDITTNSAGDVFAMWPDTTSRRLLVARSTDGGVNFASPVTVATTFDGFDIGIPAMADRRALIYLSAGAFRTATKNLVYALWTDLSGAANCTSAANEPGSNVASPCKTRIWFSRSTDGGTTWSAASTINNQASLNDQFNPRLAVDEVDGTLVVTYYDTVGDAARLKTDLWYQTSSDSGVTWSAAAKVTSAPTDETVAGADSGNQYGDYNGLSGHAGEFFPTWTDRRNGKKEEIWTAPISVYDEAAWVTSLYADLLARAPDKDGLDFWVALRAGGSSLQDVVSGFLNSTEYCNSVVFSLYTGLLGRQPDPAGLQFWISRLQGGTPRQEVQTGFLDSEEYRTNNPPPEQFVESLYSNVLGRGSDPVGKQFWIDALSGGASTADVIRGFLSSQEYCTQRVTELYDTLLGRAPDSVGLAFWVTVMSTGTAFQELQYGFLASKEYRIRSLRRF